MQTMHPCIMLGSYVLDHDRLPADEFRLRMEKVYGLMEERGLAALLVYGDAREHGALAYLSNFIPRMRWGMALFSRGGEPRLLCSISSRDMPAMRAMTWIGDVYSGWEWKWFDEWLANLKPEAGDIGTVGFGIMAPPLYRNIERSLGNRFKLTDQPDIAAMREERKRPRELPLVMSSCEITTRAVKELADSWRAHGDPERAALAAERMARGMAAQDVRTLVSFDGGRTLQPFRGTFDTKTSSLVAYVAVKFAGYWSESFVGSNVSEAQASIASAALDALVRSMRPGIPCGTLYDIACRQLAGAMLHPALLGCVGHGIGLSLEEGEQIVAGATATIRANQIYALQVGLDSGSGGCFASAMVHVTDRETSVISRSAMQ